MFTGIIESLGRIESIENVGINLRLWIRSSLFSELRTDQSLAHNGICLTIDQLDAPNQLYRVTAIEETILKTNVSNYVAGDLLNLERAMLLSQRLDGHLVQGHIDETCQILDISEYRDTCNIVLVYNAKFRNLIIEKGSIALNGISLTCHSLIDNTFQVSIIPYTYENTNIHAWKKGDRINLEFDLVGKYIQRRLSLNS